MAWKEVESHAEKAVRIGMRNAYGACDKHKGHDVNTKFGEGFGTASIITVFTSLMLFLITQSYYQNHPVIQYQDRVVTQQVAPVKVKLHFSCVFNNNKTQEGDATISAQAPVNLLDIKTCTVTYNQAAQ